MDNINKFVLTYKHKKYKISILEVSFSSVSCASDTELINI